MDQKRALGIAMLLLKWLVSNTGIIVGLTSFLFGVIQYKKGQDWKKSEFASKQLELLINDPMLNIATKALEWKKRKFPMPEQYQYIYKTKVFHHNVEDMERAMIPGTENTENIDMMMALYSDIYDYFFDYLERINDYININLFTIEDVESVCYWLDHLKDPKHVENKNLFSNYMEAYNYKKISLLIERCEQLE